MSKSIFEVRPIPVIPAAFVIQSRQTGDLAHASIVIHFDNDPGDITTSVGSISGSGTSRTKGPFTLGFLSLN